MGDHASQDELVAHSAYQSRPAAEAAIEELGLVGHKTKIEAVTLHD